MHGGKIEQCLRVNMISSCVQAMAGRPMPGVRQQHIPNQYRNNRAPASSNRHQMNHAPYGGHMNTSQASQVSFKHK
jgi:hypothetical protein